MNRPPSCSMPLFHQPWWLNALEPGAWDAASIEADGRVIASLPYVRERRFGLVLLRQPSLTQFLGPWLQDREGKYVTRLTREHELIESLIAQLPKFDVFTQSLSWTRGNILPFYWKGFSSEVRYTYRIDANSDPDQLWTDFHERTRRNVAKAKKHVEIGESLDLGRFIHFNQEVFARQGLKLPYSQELLKRIDSACGGRGVRKILFAEDAKENVHAAVYLVWDETTCYYLMSGADSELRSSGAGTLLMWESIKFAMKNGLAFDFEGSMIKPIEQFFRGFGARQTPYYRVTKMSQRARALLSVRDATLAVFGRS